MHSPPATTKSDTPKNLVSTLLHGIVHHGKLILKCTAITALGIAGYKVVEWLRTTNSSSSAKDKTQQESQSTTSITNQTIQFEASSAIDSDKFAGIETSLLISSTRGSGIGTGNGFGTGLDALDRRMLSAQRSLQATDPTPQNCMASWSLRGNAIDTCNGNNGTLFGVVPTTDVFGEANGALYFDRRSHISVPHSPSFNFTGSFTIIIEVVPEQDAATAQFLVCKHIAGMNTDSFAMAINSENTPYFPSYTFNGLSRSLTAQSVLHARRVYCLAASYDVKTSTFTWTINGNVDKTYIEFLGFTDNNMFPILLGAEEYTPAITFFLGKLSLVSLSSSALPLNTIKSLCTPPTPDGLGAYYLLASTANDISGNNNNPTTVSNVAFSTPSRFGVPSSAAAFAGNGFIAIPSSSSLTLPGNWTTSFWIKPAQLPTINSFSLVSTSSGSLELLPNAAVRFVNGTAGGISSISTGALPIGFWSHVAAICDAEHTQLSLYINGTLDSTHTRQCVLTSGDFTIGAMQQQSGQYGLFFAGNLAGVRIDRRAFSPSQVAALYAPYPTIRNLGTIGPGTQGIMNGNNLGASYDGSLMPNQITVTLSGTHITFTPNQFSLLTLLKNGISWSRDCSQSNASATATFCDPFACNGPFPLSIDNALLTPTINRTLTSQLSGSTAGIGQLYSTTISSDTFSGLCSPIVYSAITPDGISFNPITRTLNGTATNVSQIGIFNLQITATDAGGRSISDSYPLPIPQTFIVNFTSKITCIADQPCTLTPAPTMTTPSSWATASITLNDTAAGTLSTGISPNSTALFANSTWLASDNPAMLNLYFSNFTDFLPLYFNKNFSIMVNLRDGFGQYLNFTTDVFVIPVNHAPRFTMPLTSLCQSSTQHAENALSSQQEAQQLIAGAITHRQLSTPEIQNPSSPVRFIRPATVLIPGALIIFGIWKCVTPKNPRQRDEMQTESTPRPSSSL